MAEEQMSPAVEAATVLKLEQEAELFRAKTAQTNLETGLFQIDLDRQKDVRQRELSSDYYYRIYPFTSTVNAQSVQACLGQINQWVRQDHKAPIEIIFTSPGGSVTDGLALFDHILGIRALGTRVDTTALGMAASMAGILLQAGEKRTIGAESWLMIHEVSFGTSGKIGEVEDTTAWVKAVQKRVLRIFADRSHLTIRQLDHKWKRQDWWIDSTEALKLGLVDEIR